MEGPFREAVRGLMDFIQASPTAFHAVAGALDRLRNEGFTELDEADAWRLVPHGRYCVTRNGSSLAAFVPGGEPPAKAGFRIIGAHTDSPGLRLKPQAAFVRHGYLQLGVEVYGGPILASWVDRDLGLAGRVILGGPGARTEARLVRIDRPIARVPEVAIHLDREVNEKGLQLNREAHLPPVLGLTADEEWSVEALLGEELRVDPSRILDQDLMLFDLTAPALGGRQEEFLFASRLDNLAGSFEALRALLASAGTATAATRVVVLYDNEEIGSNTRQGAAGPFLEELLARITAGVEKGGEEGGEVRPAARETGKGRTGVKRTPGNPSAGAHPDALYRARARSWLLSADMAHAVHPNYAERHEPRHLPRLNGGPVIKYNANARYATDAASGAFFQSICRDAEVPYQRWVNRTDLPCGSTIGPVISTRLGIRTVDIGCSMLSMHSCREMAGSLDPWHMIRAMTRFFSE